MLSKIKFPMLGIAISLVFSFIAIKSPNYHLRFIRNRVGIATAPLLHISGRSGGSGFQVSTEKGNTYIVTNKHVCNGQEYLIALIDNEPSLHRVIETSREHDMCLVESSSRLGTLNLGSDPEVGDTIAIVGYPMLTPLQVSRGEVNSFMPGMQLSFLTALDLPPMVPVYWTGAASYPGNSGSPVVDFFGNVVGILFAGGADHINMIVPVSSLEKFLKDK